MNDSFSEHSIILVKDQQTEKSSDVYDDSTYYSSEPSSYYKPKLIQKIIRNETNKKPFLIDMWDKTKHLCSTCMSFILVLLMIYLLFKIFSNMRI
jgi:hypothetical protein